LLKGLKIELIDERDETKETFLYENGIEAFVAYLNEEKDVFLKWSRLKGEHHGIEVDFAFQFNDGYSENILSFVNNVRTKTEEPMSPVQKRR
jgi:topoisomerase-4 subunit B